MQAKIAQKANDQHVYVVNRLLGKSSWEVKQTHTKKTSKHIKQEVKTCVGFLAHQHI